MIIMMNVKGFIVNYLIILDSFLVYAIIFKLV